MHIINNRDLRIKIINVLMIYLYRSIDLMLYNKPPVKYFQHIFYLK